MRCRVKICCIASPHEARLAVAAGADALGLVGPMPSGPGPIDLASAARIAATVPPAVSSFLLSASSDAERLIEEVRLTGVQVLQMVDAVDGTVHERLRTALPALRLVQVIHVEGEAAIREARELAARVDAILLDSGRPSAGVPELGGTGRVHDWSVSADLVRAVDLPVFLAGGLNAGNVGPAIARVRPYGVDLCTGVRSDGALDPAKLAAFMQAVAQA